MTRAIVAKERGLEPLSLWLMLQQPGDPAAEAAKYINPEKEVPDAESALAGARDILAETVSDDADIRKALREMMMREGVLVTKAAKEEDSVYSMYYDFREPVRSMAAHRILAVNRGEREEFLKVTLEVPEERAWTASGKSMSGTPPRECSQYEGAVFPCIVRKKTPGSKYSSTSGLSPRGHLERQAEFHASTQDEA